MNAIVALIPVSIVLLIVGGIALFWAVDHGQFDDMDTPGLLPLEDDARADDRMGPGIAAVPPETAMARSDFEAGLADPVGPTSR